jgi:menaquinone-specific isochorismate synthase
VIRAQIEGAAAAPATQMIRDLLENGLLRAQAGSGISCVVMPAPVASPEAFWSGIDSRPGAFWSPRNSAEPVLVGVDVALELRPTGPDRAGALAAAAAAMTFTVIEAGVDAAPLRLPRFFGGLSFADAAPDEVAPDFGRGWFFLPRWTYVRFEHRAFLILAVDAAAALRSGQWHDELSQHLQSLVVSASRAPLSQVVARTDLSRGQWHAHVAAARGAIARGEFAKVVAARSTHVELAQEIDTGAMLGALGERHAECTRFAFRPRKGGRVFLGATPERLVSVDGVRVESEALAGSVMRTDDLGHDHAQLLASRKDRWEHAIVVDAIAAALRPRSVSLTVPAVPTVRSLRHLHHLHSPITAILAQPTHVLGLVGALHPTPAVGGWPAVPAQEFIAAQEGGSREWYAGPVGWFGPDGDGEFAVAIRSAMVDGRHAQVWAGAGIVSESEAELEWAEVELKQRAVIQALGTESST